MRASSSHPSCRSVLVFLPGLVLCCAHAGSFALDSGLGSRAPAIYEIDAFVSSSIGAAGPFISLEGVAALDDGRVRAVGSYSTGAGRRPFGLEIGADGQFSNFVQFAALTTAPGDGQGEALAISPNGEFVCGASTQASLWRWDSPGVIQTFVGSGVPAEFFMGRSTDVNDLGTVVGSVEVQFSPPLVRNGFAWSPSTGIRLLPPFNGTTRAVGISEAGRIVGDTGLDVAPVVWDTLLAEPTFLEVPGGVSAFAYSISPDGRLITGTASTSIKTSSAVIWEDLTPGFGPSSTRIAAITNEAVGIGIWGPTFSNFETFAYIFSGESARPFRDWYLETFGTDMGEVFAGKDIVCDDFDCWAAVEGSMAMLVRFPLDAIAPRSASEAWELYDE